MRYRTKKKKIKLNILGYQNNEAKQKKGLDLVSGFPWLAVLGGSVLGCGMGLNWGLVLLSLLPSAPVVA